MKKFNQPHIEINDLSKSRQGKRNSKISSEAGETRVRVRTTQISFLQFNQRMRDLKEKDVHAPLQARERIKLKRLKKIKLAKKNERKIALDRAYLLSRQIVVGIKSSANSSIIRRNLG